MFGQETVYTYKEDTGRVQQILKPGGAEVNLAYSAAGDVLAVTDAQGLGYAFQYTYDPHN